MNFLVSYYLPVIVLISTAFIVIKNRSADNRQVTKWSIVAIMEVALLVLAEFLAYQVFLRQEQVFFRTLFRFIRFSIIPFIVLSFIRIAFPRNRASMVVLFIAIANALVYSTAFFTPAVAFGYAAGDGAGAETVFVRGQLWFLSYVLSSLFILDYLIRSMVSFKKNHRSEILPILLIVIGCLGAGFLEILSEHYSGLTEFLAVAFLFDYLYICLQASRSDALTGLYNRRTFYADLERGAGSITGILSIDMNGLKYLNDHFGHEAGDRGLETIADVFREAMTHDMDGYRLGGDEFAILCFRMTEEEIKEREEAIYRLLSGTDYSCSIGHAHISECADLNGLVALADTKMYNAKKQHYSDLK